MKILILSLATILGIIFGILPGLNKPKSMLFKIIIIVLVVVTVVLGLWPPIGINTLGAYDLSTMNYSHPISVEMQTKPAQNKFETDKGRWIIGIEDENANFDLPPIVVKGSALPDEFKTSNKLVVQVLFNKGTNEYNYLSTSAINPAIIYPFIPALEERVRIITFHVPMAWISVLAYLISMIFSIRYLKTRNHEFDLKASSAAALGLVFTLLATLTGMLWAKYNWGSYWNWDPREVSIFILLLIYAAYFALRSSLENEELRARLSSVYSILAFITVPFLIFILPRIQSGLHPGSASDSTSGPVLSSQPGTMDTAMLYVFGLSLMVFTLLFFWLLNLNIRAKLLKEKLNKRFE